MSYDMDELQPARSVPRYARIDVIGGTLIVLVAGLVWFGAIGLDVGSIQYFGPGALPDVLSIVLAVAGIALLLRGLIQLEDKAKPLEFAVRPTAIVVLSIALFGLFIRGGQFGFITTPQLGLAIIGPLTVFIAGCAAPEPRLRQLLVLAFGLVAVMLFIFVDLLRVNIPVFPLFVQKAIPPAFGADNALRVLCGAYAALSAALYVLFVRSLETPRG